MHSSCFLQQILWLILALFQTVFYLFIAARMGFITEFTALTALAHALR